MEIEKNMVKASPNPSQGGEPWENITGLFFAYLNYLSIKSAGRYIIYY
jgi:hypothetical protein